MLLMGVVVCLKGIRYGSDRDVGVDNEGYKIEDVAEEDVI